MPQDPAVTAHKDEVKLLADYREMLEGPGPEGHMLSDTPDRVARSTRLRPEVRCVWLRGDVCLRDSFGCVRLTILAV